MKIKINGVAYDVQVGETESGYFVGQIFFDRKHIKLRPDFCGTPRTRKEREKTMWHEFVHGIFHEIGRKRLARDEQLVDDVAVAIIEIQKQLEKYGTAQLLGD